MVEKYIVGRKDGRVVSRFVGRNIIRKGFLMGAWTVEYPSEHYKVVTTKTGKDIGDKIRVRRK